ncbi:MAG: outer membrane protein transport protein [Candidatus Omnitrophota bacterium]|nr:outer membrane protein transport protein [Candidatus Omnitrophota bacterium]
MFKKYNALIVSFVLVSALCFVLGEPAYAGNGTRFLGFSSRDSAMAGATTASSEDTSCLVRNPAGLVRIGNKIDVEYQNIIAHDVTMHTEGPGLAALGGATFVNAGMRQKSNITYLPGGNAGVSYRIPGTDKYPVSVGCGVFTMAGIALNYPSSRLNSALTGNYDKMIDLRSMRIAPGIAVAFNDKLSFGGTANIGIQGLRTNMATSILSGGRYLETAGGGDWDFVPGGGFTLGLLYKFNEMLDLGAAYESHGWMGHHYKYKDSLPYIDEPPVISVGLSLKPVKNLELTYDTRYINWTDVKLARNGPSSGGFGWGDQWVFAVGGEYTFKDKKENDKLKLRLGYNYGKSPIQPHVVFANALLPVIMEHHLTTGFSYFITKNLSLDFVWEHHFFNAMADNGAGDVYSVNGAGTKVTAAAEVIGVGLGYKF